MLTQDDTTLTRLVLDRQSPRRGRSILSNLSRVLVSRRWMQRTATFFAHLDSILRSTDRYNPQNLNVLTEYLEHQLQNGEYDCLANLSILKL